MKQYSVTTEFSQETEQSQETQLHWKIECLYKNLGLIYGTQGLILRASKLDAIDLMGSQKLEERVLALQRILQEDPTINEVDPPAISTWPWIVWKKRWQRFSPGKALKSRFNSVFRKKWMKNTASISGI